MATLDFSGIEKLAEEAVIRGAQRGIAKVAQMLGGSERKDEGPFRAPARSKRAAKNSGGRRSPRELAELNEKIHGHIKANPGQGVEQIGKALGIGTDELKRPMKKLVDSGHVKTKGQKRGTRYFAA